VRRIFRGLLVLALAASLGGCLGTFVQTRAKAGRPIVTTNLHFLAAPFRIDAHVCEKGLAQVTTFVPVWGVVVGILTFGILVPKSTVYQCAEGR
jgi:hypothetical protein